MGIFLFWILLSFVVGSIGSDRTIGFWGAFILSLLLSPLIGGIIALASTKNSTIEFQRRMLADKEEKTDLTKRASLADDLSQLERSYLEGKITVYDYETQKENILRRHRQL